MSKKLKACPFCGSKDIDSPCVPPGNQPGFTSWRISCSKCSCSITSYDKSNDAVEIWNKRA